MEEQLLIEKIKAGDENAFQYLVEKNQTMVINTCYGFLHNYDDAQDVAQEVFIKVYHSINKFRKDAKLSTWLYRISVNKSLNFIRDNKKKTWLQKIDALFEVENSSNIANSNSDTPYEVMENNEKAQIIQTAIDKLPEKQRTAFILDKYEELTYKEITEVMKTSLASVESLLFRAKKNLQKHLINYYKR